MFVGIPWHGQPFGLERINMRIVAEERQMLHVGDKFHRLTVIGVPFWVRRGQWHAQHVVCECECGAITISTCVDLKCSRKFSCGCFMKERAAETCRSRAIHGESP